jgi:hypothetical protein
MMNKFVRSRLTYLLASSTLIVLLGDQAFACLFPSLTEMIGGRPMACCSQRCRVDTTPQAAQQACEQSRTAISQHQVMAGPSTSVVKIELKDLPNTGLCSIHELPVSHPISDLFSTKADTLVPPDRTVDLYLFTHSLLI